MDRLGDDRADRSGGETDRRARRLDERRERVEAAVQAVAVGIVCVRYESAPMSRKMGRGVREKRRRTDEEDGRGGDVADENGERFQGALTDLQRGGDESVAS